MTNSEKEMPSFKERMKAYDRNVNERLNDDKFQIDSIGVHKWNKLSTTNSDEQFTAEIHNRSTGDSRSTIDIYDNYILMEVGLPRGSDGEIVHATVKRRSSQ